MLIIKDHIILGNILFKSEVLKKFIRANPGFFLNSASKKKCQFLL
jgi:hypothetical protein